MSAYSEHATSFTEQTLLVSALQALGLNVVTHPVPVKIGYWTSVKAEVIVPPQNGAHYPMGMRKTEQGTFAIVPAVEDSKVYDAAFMNRLKVQYAHHGIMRQAAKAGLRATGKPKMVNGNLHVQFVKA